MILKNWKLKKEDGQLFVTGNIHNHPDYEEGELITTNAVKKYRNELIITDSGSEYLLGDTDDKGQKILVVKDHLGMGLVL